WLYGVWGRGSRGKLGAAVFLTDPKLFKERGQIETERIKLLQEIEDHSRAGLGQAREPRAASIGHAIALIDDDKFIDIAERSGDCTKNASGRLNNCAQLFKHRL